MRLHELAYICRVYAGLTSFDGTYFAFLEETGGSLDFGNPAHMKTLLKWLNSWGCRQFAIEYHDLASESILEWAKRWERRLPDRFKPLGRLSDDDIQATGEAYGCLSGCVASRVTRGGKTYDVRVGPTGAAKILFAARPRALPPWDDPIRAKWGLDGGRLSYCAYLTRVRQEVKQVCDEAAKAGIDAEDLPQELGRPGSTLPKLIDEYNWITLTRGFVPPGPEEIAKWYRWSSHR